MGCILNFLYKNSFIKHYAEDYTAHLEYVK